PSEYFARWNDGLLSASFSEANASRQGTSVILGWTATGETNHQGYEVFREPEDSPRERLGAPTTEPDNRFTFEDPAPPSSAVSYWIRETGPFGSEEWHGPITVAPLPVGLSV